MLLLRQVAWTALLELAGTCMCRKGQELGAGFVNHRLAKQFVIICQKYGSKPFPKIILKGPERNGSSSDFNQTFGT